MKLKNLDSIQAMRGAAALLVVFYHCRIYLNEVYSQKDIGDILFSYGYVGVDLFFIISGFIITYVTSNKEKQSGLSYVSKRFFKIYPTFLFCLLIVCILRGMDFNTFRLTGGFITENIIKSMFFIPLSFNSPPYTASNLLPVAWTITFEVVFYFLFFIGMSINHKARGIITSIIILGGFLAVASINNNYSTNPAAHKFNIKIIELVTNPIMIMFILGIISNYIFTLLQKLNKTKVTFFSYVALGCSLILFLSGNFNGHGVLNYGFICFIVFISTMSIIEFNNIKIYRWVLYLGEISYSLYLTHMIIIMTIDKYTTRFPLIGDTSGWAKFLSVVTLSLLSATAVYFFIEKPCVAIARNFAKKKAE